ncbi:hypothetical protein AGMMS49587_18640 [Spirochaetia bacterium]|nr:hypothetical protein AGMMS49587_18640 [Spirochaetia bacterium]
MKTLTQEKLVDLFSNAATADATKALLTQVYFEALEDDGEGWGYYSALIDESKTLVAAYLYAAKATYSTVDDLKDALHDVIGMAISYQGNLIVTGAVGAVAANASYYAVDADTAADFIAFIPSIDDATTRSQIEAKTAYSGTPLVDFDETSLEFVVGRGDKIIVVEYDASTGGNVLAYSATPGTVPAGINDNDDITIGLTAAPEGEAPTSVVLATGSYGTAGTTSITGLTAGKYIVQVGVNWYSTATGTGGANTLAAIPSGSIALAIDATDSDTTSITGLTSGTTYDVYKVVGIPFGGAGAAGIKNTIVDASSIVDQTVTSVLTSGITTALNSKVLVHLSQPITTAVGEALLAPTHFLQNITYTIEPSGLGVVSTTKIAATSGNMYFTLSTIDATTTMSLARKTKLANITIADVVAPVRYVSPVTTGPTASNVTSGSIAWTVTGGSTPVGDTFAAGTEYTATFTLTSTTHTFKGASPILSVTGSPTASVNSDGVVTAPFAATAAFALLDLPASAKYTGTTLASASDEVSLNSGILTFNSSGVKTAKITTAEGSDGQKINNLLANLAANDLFTTSAGAITGSTLKTAPSLNSVTKIGNLLGIADLTIDYASPELGGVTVPENKTLTLDTGVAELTPAIVSTSSTLTVTATGATLAGSGYIKTDGGTITYGTLSGLTATTALTPTDLEAGIGKLVLDLEAIATANATNAITVKTAADNFGPADLDPGPLLDTGTTIVGDGIEVDSGLPAGLNSVSLSYSGTDLQITAAGTSQNVAGTPIDFVGKLKNGGVTSDDITITVTITTEVPD